MSAPTKRRGPDGTNPGTVLLWVIIIAVAVLLIVTNLGVHFGRTIDNLPTIPLGNPFSLTLGLFNGKTEWTAGSWVSATIVVAGMAGLYFLGRVGFRSKSNRFPVDRAAQYMGKGKAITCVSYRGVREKADVLGVKGVAGVFVGLSVATGMRLFTSWEDVALLIAGPRTGKTTCLVIPPIADAPGAVVTTSNKRDVVDATRLLRSAIGTVWVFDPQSVANEQPTWWWNPLSYVTNEVKSIQLAKLFSDASRPSGSRRDAFFDGSAETLLSAMLLAAALEVRPLSMVYLWLTDVRNDEAVHILRRHNEVKSAASLQQIIYAPEKQKGGIYGTAQQIMSFLINSEAVKWVEKTGTGDQRPEFNPTQFVRSTDTLYSLSKEGVGSTGPLVTALTVAVTEAAEEYAKQQPGGRLATPMLLILDEAANICRWNNLPDLYSHYGSRGISISTILQSWSQGVEVWGQDGMRKLWTAANAKMYLGGVDEPQFLNDLSQLIGDFERNSRSVSYSAGGTSNQHQARFERVLDASDLRALPRGRAVLLYSGIPPVLMRTIPWMTGPHADKIKAGISRNRVSPETVEIQGA